MRKKQIKVEEETLPIRTFLRQIQAQTKSASQISPSHFAHDLSFPSPASNSEKEKPNKKYTHIKMRQNALKQHQNNKKGKSKK
jgi:hypothetical protein